MVLLACAMLAFFTSCSQDGDSSSSNPDGFEPGWYEYIGESFSIDEFAGYDPERDKKAFFNFDKNCKITAIFIDSMITDFGKNPEYCNKMINFSMLKNGATTFQKITLEQLFSECRDAIPFYDPEISQFVKSLYIEELHTWGGAYYYDQKIYYPGKVSKILITNSEPDCWRDTEHDIENDLHELNKTLVISTDEKGNYFQFKAYTDEPSYQENAYVNLYVQQHDFPFFSYDAFIFRPSEE